MVRRKIKWSRSQSFSINGNPTNLNIQIQKLNYDLNDLTVQLLVNGTVVESESTGQDSDAVIFNYDFDPYDGF